MAQPKSITDIKNLETKVSDATNKLNEQTSRIDELSANKNKIFNNGAIEYDTPTKPSDYTSNSITSVTIRRCSVTEASEYGYWNNILAIKNHGDNNCFELGFTDNGNVIFRKQNGANDTWSNWQQLATTDQINVLSTGVNDLERTRKLRTYTSLTDIEGITTESTFSQIATAMPNNSLVSFSNYTPLNWFPQSVQGDRNDIEITRYSGGINYIKVWLSNVRTGVWHGYYTEQTGLVWQQLATTTKTDMQQYLTGGWTVVSDCVFSAQKIGNRIFIEGIIQNSSPSQKTIAVGLPIPSDRKWHGGVGVGTNNGAMYMVIDPAGTLSFQSGGYTQGIPYSISIDYPV